MFIKASLKNQRSPFYAGTGTWEWYTFIVQPSIYKTYMRITPTLLQTTQNSQLYNKDPPFCAPF
jgi:hypothetical protein